MASSAVGYVRIQSGRGRPRAMVATMLLDDIKAAIADEKEVNVGNWTYTANDTLISKFTEYVKTTYGVDVQ